VFVSNVGSEQHHVFVSNVGSEQQHVFVSNAGSEQQHVFVSNAGSERQHVVDDKWWTLSRRFRSVTRGTVPVGQQVGRAEAQLQEEDCLSVEASSSSLTMATRWVEFLHF